MKKLLSLSLCVLMLLSLCACGESKNDEQPENNNTQLANPVTAYGSLSEVNELLGCKLSSPAVMGVSDESFAVIDSEDFPIGEYKFSVNGMAYCLRFCGSYDEDISGVYIDGSPAFSGQAKSSEYGETDEMKLARWADIAGQYVLTVTDNGEMEQSTFEGIVSEMMDATNPAMSGAELSAYYASLAGEYQDSVSERAMMTVTANGSEGIGIEVSWGNSAFESCEWKMTAARGEDGLLYYTDCVSTVLKTAEDGTESVDTLSTDGEGFFSESEGKLLWNGAADENCRECVFEKLA